MAARCEHCKFWRDTVFKCESATGWGVWHGDCTSPYRNDLRAKKLHSLMLACTHFQHTGSPRVLPAEPK